MKIQVVGTGCPTCKKLYEVVQKAVLELGLKAKVEYTTGEKGMQILIEKGVMSSPAIVVDGTVVMTGFTPDVEKIKKYLSLDLKKENKSSACSCGGNC